MLGGPTIAEITKPTEIPKLAKIHGNNVLIVKDKLDKMPRREDKKINKIKIGIPKKEGKKYSEVTTGLNSDILVNVR